MRADPVVELDRHEDTIHLLIRGFTEAGPVGAYFWPSGGPPSGVQISLLVAIERPSQLGLFELKGITDQALNKMDPAEVERFKSPGLMDPVIRLERGDTWRLTVRGFLDAKALGHYMWPSSGPPAGVRIVPVRVVEKPVRTGEFQLAGFNGHIAGMRNDLARKVLDTGPFDSTIEMARAAFRTRHNDHDPKVLDNIDAALKRVTKNNPDLLFAYYNYYADAKLTDEIDSRSTLGETSSGDTDINKRLLNLNLQGTTIQTDDPLSLLGGTLIHEYVHTPQGGGSTGLEAPQEAKAYAIELVLAERMGDQKRADFISRRYAGNDVVDINTGSDRIFRRTYNTMRALYDLIDKGGPEVRKAREMSVEFISKNKEDYSPELKAFVAKNS